MVVVVRGYYWGYIRNDNEKRKGILNHHRKVVFECDPAINFTNIKDK